MDDQKIDRYITDQIRKRDITLYDSLVGNTLTPHRRRKARTRTSGPGGTGSPAYAGTSDYASSSQRASSTLPFPTTT